MGVITDKHGQRWIERQSQILNGSEFRMVTRSNFIANPAVPDCRAGTPYTQPGKRWPRMVT